MDSVGAFNVFVQVAETRSFVAAGRLLGVSASAVGKRISALEERLGTRLFHRSTRSVTLTAEGVLFLERSRRILDEIDAAEAELAQIHQEPRGRLRISLPLVGEPFLSVIASFKHAYPDVDLDLDFTDRTVDIIEEGYDAVIRSGDAADSRLTTRLLGKFRTSLVGTPRYFAKHGTPMRPADLAHHACIQFRFPNTGKLQAWPLRRDKHDPEFLLPASIISNNLETRITFALNDLGIAYLGDFAIQEHLRNGRLIRILEKYSDSADTFRIMWPSGKYMAPKLRVFIDFLCEWLFPAADSTKKISPLEARASGRGSKKKQDRPQPAHPTQTGSAAE